MNLIKLHTFNYKTVDAPGVVHIAQGHIVHLVPSSRNRLSEESVPITIVTDVNDREFYVLETLTQILEQME